MRAAETGRPVVQAGISGISAFIDASGREHARTSLFERTVLQGTVTAMKGETLYVRYGEWVTGLAIVAVAACVIVGIVRRRRASVDSDRRAEDAPAEAVPATAGDPV
jgi:apolipoprotein N-acyltransferase